MSVIRRFFSIKTASEKRLLVLLVFLGIGWIALKAYESWEPTHVEVSKHYEVASTVSPEHTREVAERAELLFDEYRRVFGEELEIETPKRPLRLRVYETRDEFKRTNVLVQGYAEAVYRNKTCHQYLDMTKPNPWHWMLHEVTHQLNHEVAKLRLKLWLDEGLACYFATSQMRDDEIHLGKPDFNTYPIWWLPSVKLTGIWEEDVEADKIIPLRQLIRDAGPNRSEHFNTYYLHWWSWMHFLFHAEDGKYREALPQLVKSGGSIRDFEKWIGPTEKLEREWYAYYQNWIESTQPPKTKMASF